MSFMDTLSISSIFSFGDTLFPFSISQIATSRLPSFGFFVLEKKEVHPRQISIWLVLSKPQREEIKYACLLFLTLKKRGCFKVQSGLNFNFFAMLKSSLYYSINLQRAPYFF